METENARPKRLFKSRRDRMIDGVCAGIAEYLDIDPAILRILWVLSILVGGVGIVAYIACMIIMPANPDHSGVMGQGGSARLPGQQRRHLGIIVVAAGIIILLINLGVFGFLHVWHLSWTLLFAVILIGVGVSLILRTASVPEQPPAADGGGSSDMRTHRLEKIRKDRKLLGVCGGIAKYFDIDPSIVRILFILFALTHGIGILAYFVLALVLPDETPQQA